MRRFGVAAIIVAAAVVTVTLYASADNSSQQGGTAPVPTPVLYTEEQLVAHTQAYSDAVAEAFNDAIENMKFQMWAAGLDQQDIIVNNLAEAAYSHEGLTVRTGALLEAFDRLGLDAKALGLEVVEASPMADCHWIKSPRMDVAMCPAGSAP